MSILLEVLNHPAKAFKEKSKTLSWILVIITVLINSIFEPMLQNIASPGLRGISVERMARTTVLGILCYVVICFALWMVCKIFKSKATLNDHMIIWGMTYLPTIICGVAVAITEAYSSMFWNNTFWGMFFSIVFMGILFWKIILFVTYLDEVAQLKGWNLLGAFLLLVVIIGVMAALCGALGLKTPVI